MNVRHGVGAACLGAMLLGPAAPARAQDPEQIAMASIRLTTEPGRANGCTRVGRVTDDSVKDLRRKILRIGGNVGVISFGGIENMSTIYADVFRCAPPSAAPATPRAPYTQPPNLPPPPPGPPPPPPPGIPR